MLQYPSSVYFIIGMEFCERYAFCGLRTILSLYLKNSLHFTEDSATVIYHVFIMVCYITPFFGAILADGYCGRFRTILYFSIVYTIGGIVLSFSSVPSISPFPIVLTMIGLVLVATGTGGIKPCVAAFGGDQFHLPAEETRVQEFFTLFYFTINLGGLIGIIVSPLLRQATACFGDDTCYALGFGPPAVFMLLSLVLFIAGKGSYRKKAPKGNVFYEFISCLKETIRKRYASPELKGEHWLDYAKEKYDYKTLSDFKLVLKILVLFIPVPIFWSLFDQQGSRWTFQASKMKGEFYGIFILPDQMQVINPAIVLFLIPLFESVVFPWMNKKGILPAPLMKMTIGGFFAGFAFIASGITEMKLQEETPFTPGENRSRIDIINTLPCDIQIMNPFNTVQDVESRSYQALDNIPADSSTNVDLITFSPYSCGDMNFPDPCVLSRVSLRENEINTLVVTTTGVSFSVNNIGTDDVNKSQSGKPKLRIVFIRETLTGEHVTVTVKKGHHCSYTFPISEEKIYISPYIEVEPGRYKYKTTEFKNTDVPETYTLNLGGVYTLIMQEVDKTIKFSRIFAITPPNDISVMWLIPQYILLSIAEILFAITGLQFSFNQSPKCMKTMTIAAWYITVAAGNLLVIIVTQAGIFPDQASEFFFFAGLLIVDMVLFLIMIWNYEYVPVDPDESSIVCRFNILASFDSDEEDLLQGSNRANDGTSTSEKISELTWDDVNSS